VHRPATPVRPTTGRSCRALPVIAPTLLGCRGCDSGITYPSRVPRVQIAQRHLSFSLLVVTVFRWREGHECRYRALLREGRPSVEPGDGHHAATPEYDKAELGPPRISEGRDAEREHSYAEEDTQDAYRLARLVAVHSGQGSLSQGGVEADRTPGRVAASCYAGGVTQTGESTGGSRPPPSSDYGERHLTTLPV
jgi:hypothetical protein